VEEGQLGALLTGSWGLEESVTQESVGFGPGLSNSVLDSRLFSITAMDRIRSHYFHIYV
jgi:hypothetical protein